MEQLGNGQFGTVHRAVWHNCPDNNSPSSEGKLEVAVKSMKSGASESERVKFLQEAAIMAQFNNPQVLRILGVVTKGDDVRIIFKYTWLK